MRSNQQNKNRSRGRNNGRKHANPLSRNYESNGPDVKIRGNASHIAEKYVQLARDAQATGDSVMAENYLQHAEHYFRIVSAAQVQVAQRQEQAAEANTKQPGIDGEPSADAKEASGGAVDADGDKPADEDSKVAEAQADATGEDDASAGEGEQRRPRRPRRRKYAETAEKSADGEGGDPTSAPQPEVGDLPAFLTGGPAANAAE